MHVVPLRAVGYTCFTAVSPVGHIRSRWHGPTPVPPAWMGLAIRPEGRPRSGYDRERLGSDYRFFEDENTVGIPTTGARFPAPHMCTGHDMREDGTAEAPEV